MLDSVVNSQPVPTSSYPIMFMDSRGKEVVHLYRYEQMRGGQERLALTPMGNSRAPVHHNSIKEDQ